MNQFKTKKEFMDFIFSNSFKNYVEYEDKIVCYIQNIDAKYSVSGTSNLSLKGLKNGKNYFLIEDAVDEYNVGKPIYYFFDGIIFEYSVKVDMLVGSGVTIIFKNCTFKGSILISDVDRVIFENNKYFDCNKNDLDEIRKKHFLTIESTEGQNVDNITFLNENFRNSLDASIPLYYTTGFGMSIKANEVEILASSIETNFPSDISANSIKLFNSSITGPEFSIDANSFENRNSTIAVTEGVIIDNQKYDFNGNIEAPLVIYNGEDITECSPNGITITKREPSLKCIRQDLVYTLKKINCRVQQQITIGDIIGLKK